MKFLKTIRFDNSDEHVFETGAPPEEWAVSGAFAFSALAPDQVKGKTKQAFANGFLGLPSLGRSTFATVGEMDKTELDQVQALLARHFVDCYGAPNVAAALPAAREETDFVLDLCKDSLINTVFTVRRQFDAEGEIKEEFRTIQAPSDRPLHTRIWSVTEDEA
ncbi:MAG: DUF6505 family protein [Pseudomonadota bacterium]|nr:DUF6505 family protein [Pseudomonadota bacterium]